MAPIVHGLEAEYYNKIHFVYLDADDPDTRVFQQALGFAYQPELYLLDPQGNVLYKWIGYVDEAGFRTIFDQYD